MDEQPDVVSSGPRWFTGARWPRPGRRPWLVTSVVLAVLLACLVVSATLALLVAHRDATISDLRGALRNASHPAPAVAPPAVSGSAMFTLPYAGGGSFFVVAVAVRPGPGSPTLTLLFVYGRHASPGERYGLLEGTCGGQYITAVDLADGTADRDGNVTLVAPNLPISPRPPDVWVLVYRLEDGAPLGGVQGPLTGYGGKTFRSPPRC